MNHLLQELIEIAPLYAKSLPQEVAIGISDMEQYLALFETETLKFPFPVGMKMKDVGYQELLDEIARSGKPIVSYASKEITGSVDIKTIVAPVYDDGVMVGCMSLSINMDSEMKLENFTAILKTPIENASRKRTKEHIDAIKK